MTEQMKRINEKILALGNVNTGETEVASIVFDRGFRKLCEDNTCGNFGRNYTCPPYCGDIDELIARAKQYTHVLVYQTISPLEDSYDYEGMMEAGKQHGKLADQITTFIQEDSGPDILHLGAGGCRLCEECGVRTGAPCRFPDRAITSLEANGIAVSQLAGSCGMKYINGADTVTYFGALLFN